MDTGPLGPQVWGVRPSFTVGRLVLLGILVVVVLVSKDATQRLLAIVASIGVAGFTARDIVAGDRLRADAAGLVLVRGFIGRRALSWSQIERVRLDERSRAGTVVRTVEIDTGTDLYLFGRLDLGTDPAVVYRALQRLRAEGTGDPAPG
jgi:PH (Pleckstrin Homology) domain-containing protein